MAYTEKKKEKKAPSKLKSLDSEKAIKDKPDNTYDARPTICFNETELPEIKNWKVGEKYTVEIEIEQTGMRICDYGENKGKMEATFKISKVGVDSDES